MYDNYREFKSLDDARNFGIKYYGDWLKEFQIGGKYRNIYELSDYDYLNLKNKKGQDYAEQIKQKCLIYKTFSFYCGGNHGLAINELCRFGITKYPFDIKTLKSMIKIMDSEIEKFEIKENIIAYRTLFYRDLLRSQNKTKITKGEIIIDYGFMGVGLVKAALLKEHDYYDTNMKIFIPVGCHAIYLDLISNRLNEQEILLKRGTKLKVISNKSPIPLFCKKRKIVCSVLLDK